MCLFMYARHNLPFTTKKHANSHHHSAFHDYGRETKQTDRTETKVLLNCMDKLDLLTPDTTFDYPVPCVRKTLKIPFSHYKYPLAVYIPHHRNILLIVREYYFSKPALNTERNVTKSQKIRT